MKNKRLRMRMVALFLSALFLLLGAYGVYSVSAYGTRWFSYRSNPRLTSQKSRVEEGSIFDRNGIALAYTDDEGERRFHEDQACRKAMVHIIGDAGGHVSNAVETFQAGYLYGFERPFWEMAMDAVKGQKAKGDNVILTFDSGLCMEMVAAFDSVRKTRGHYGAAVVMNYRTGELLGEVSLPSFDPDSITASVLEHTGHPFWNRAIQSRYPPGSTFKIVTASSLLESDKDAEYRVYLCEDSLMVDNHAIHDFGDAHHGVVDLRTAFSVSCNQAFAAIALEIGNSRLRETAEQFGFNDNFLFRDLVVANSQYPTDRNRSDWELAASGFGQSAIAASPIHMCMIAGAVANGGIMMEPVQILRVENQNGRVRFELQPRQYRRVISRQTADVLTSYMASVVQSGTGTRALVEGMSVCGKTGTAESTLDGKPISYGWFIGFSANPETPYSVCVLVEDLADGEGGGSTAAPVARQIFEYLKHHPE